MQIPNALLARRGIAEGSSRPSAENRTADLSNNKLVVASGLFNGLMKLICMVCKILARTAQRT
jgi:hypothetical protein